MKKIVAAMTFVLALSASSGAMAYWCKAESLSAWGSGYSNASIQHACDIALYQCAMRTPYTQTCYITGRGW